MDEMKVDERVAKDSKAAHYFARHEPDEEKMQ